MPSQAKLNPFGLLFIWTFLLVSLGLTLHGTFYQGWWAACGLVLFMTALILAVSFYNSSLIIKIESKAETGKTQADQKSRDKGGFFPSGAIAFFTGMILFFGAVWIGLYGLMIHRQVGL